MTVTVGYDMSEIMQRQRTELCVTSQRSNGNLILFCFQRSCTEDTHPPHRLHTAAIINLFLFQTQLMRCNAN